LVGRAVAKNLFMSAIMAKVPGKSNRRGRMILGAAQLGDTQLTLVVPWIGKSPRHKGHYFSPARSFNSLTIAIAWPWPSP